MKQGAGVIPVAVVALFAALTFWLDRVTQQETKRDGRDRHDPDYIIDNFVVRRFDDTGALQHTLVAARMLHFPDDDSTEVTSPRLTYHRAPPVEVSADVARLDRDGKHVTLEGSVRVVRESVAGRPATEMKTSVLHAIPDDEVARTDAPVTITQGLSVLNGTGLEINNKTQISTLFGPTNGVIYKNQANEVPSSHETLPSKTRAASAPSVDKHSRPGARDGRKSGSRQARQPRSRSHLGR